MPDEKPIDLDDPSLHRLEGSVATKGGLIKKKDGGGGSSSSSHRQSLLGLDKLAEQKREEKKREERRYRDKRDDETPGRGVSESIRMNIVR